MTYQIYKTTTAFGKLPLERYSKLKPALERMAEIYGIARQMGDKTKKYNSRRFDVMEKLNDGRYSSDQLTFELVKG